jgi:ribonucleoside-diphosphate reductase alpha chain
MAVITSQATEMAPTQGAVQTKSGLKIGRYFTRAGVSPYDEVEWDQRTATITNEKAKSSSSKPMPRSQAWSMMATRRSVQIFPRSFQPAREYSVRQMIGGC